LNIYRCVIFYFDTFSDIKDLLYKIFTFPYQFYTFYIKLLFIIKIIQNIYFPLTVVTQNDEKYRFKGNNQMIPFIISEIQYLICLESQ